MLEKKNGKEKLGIIPCSSGVFPRLIQIPGEEGTYMLAEELILHFVPKIFSGYFVKSKSLLRVTRNADIDADALYDEDLDYREFMAEMIKKRKRLAPVRLELSRDLEGDIVDTTVQSPLIVFYSLLFSPIHLIFGHYKPVRGILHFLFKNR